ncbi:hypothetical protein IU459_16280 [Nocardia amamiensis]|uniref:DnaB helicase-like protein n=1 Tax=Nocardia amamiensis TaxID=404578 RepID=A0ABS0CTB3_9NOCA|nr:hypothetical protein [Nocardia amamiensis]MBF6299088.1 hypothetical protein [Nocardia amamiensis]
MSALPSPAPDDCPPDSDHDPVDAIPEWAPIEPLPSSEMLLAVFAGLTPITDPDILDPARDLVICQERYRLAFEVLASDAVASERMQSVARALVSSKEELDLLITAIDDAVGKRLLGRRRDGTPLLVPDHRPTPVHTESIGEIAARMAALWEVVSANVGDLDDLPEADRLMELCEGYDGLVAEIETGRRLPPGV